jgi:predicted dehydrogenase
MNGFGAMGRLARGAAYYGAVGPEDRPNGIAFYGSNGTLIADRLGFEIVPEARSGAARIERTRTAGRDATDLHVRHFIRCIRDGETPRCDAVAGHRSTLVAHLGNIACRTGGALRWDPETEDFAGAPDASRLLGRTARPPWDLISL